MQVISQLVFLKDNGKISIHFDLSDFQKMQNYVEA